MGIYNQNEFIKGIGNRDGMETGIKWELGWIGNQDAFGNRISQHSGPELGLGCMGEQGVFQIWIYLRPSWDRDGFRNRLD